MRLKYIMLNEIAVELKIPILFPEYLQHSVLAPHPRYRIVSAGFVTVEQFGGSLKVTVDGGSGSLRISRDPGDAKLIHDWLELGLSGALGEQCGIPARQTVDKNIAALDAPVNYAIDSRELIAMAFDQLADARESQAAATRSRYPMEHRPVAGRRAASEDLSKFVSPRPSTAAGEFFDRILSDTCRAVGVDKRRVISAEESRGLQW